jgi:predicted XRE-type DNA-binding protein
LTEDIREDLMYIINTKIQRSNFKTREILSKFDFLNPMLLNRINNYKSEAIKVDKLMDIINKIDQHIHNKTYGFNVNVDIESKKIIINYLGHIT